MSVNFGAPSLLSLLAQAVAAHATSVHMAVYDDGRVWIRRRVDGLMDDAPDMERLDALRIIGEAHGDPDWRPADPAEIESLVLERGKATLPEPLDCVEVEIIPLWPKGIRCVFKLKGM